MRISRLWMVCVACLLGDFAQGAESASNKFEARLIWASDEESSSDPKHRKVDGELQKKLTSSLPFKWKNFFEVIKKEFTATESTPQKVEISDKCVIEVKREGEDRVSVVLHGDGKAVNKITKPLPQGEILVIGGHEKNRCAWIVVIHRAPEPSPASEEKLEKPAAEPKPPAP